MFSATWAFDRTRIAQPGGVMPSQAPVARENVTSRGGRSVGPGSDLLCRKDIHRRGKGQGSEKARNGANPKSCRPAGDSTRPAGRRGRSALKAHQTPIKACIRLKVKRISPNIVLRTPLLSVLTPTSSVDPRAPDLSPKTAVARGVRARSPTTRSPRSQIWRPGSVVSDAPADGSRLPGCESDALLQAYCPATEGGLAGR